MARSHEAYVDTSALIALVDRADQHHARFRRLFAKPPRLVTTTLVLAEGHSWFLKKYGRERALYFLATIEENTSLSVLAAGPADVTAGLKMMRRFTDQDLTLVDAIGLHVMSVRKSARCWSSDFHLGLTGVPLAIHES